MKGLYTKRQIRLTKEELSLYFGQLAILFHAGVDSCDALGTLEKDAPSGDFRRVLTLMREIMEKEERTVLSEAMKRSGAFPDYAWSMLEIGENIAEMDQVCQALSGHYRREDAISKEIQTAVSYPLAMIAIMLVVVGILLTKILPVFNQVYTQLGSQMTGLSAGFLQAGEWMRRLGLPLTMILVLVFLLVGYLAYSGRIKLPFLRAFRREAATARFADGLSLVFKNTFLDDIGRVQLLLKNAEYGIIQEKVDRCLFHMLQGDEIHEAMEKEEIFDPLHAKMIAVGMKQGTANLSEVMERVAEDYQDKVKRQTGNLIAVIEPLMIGIMSLLVGMILLSVMLPLLGVLTGLNM